MPMRRITAQPAIKSHGYLVTSIEILFSISYSPGFSSHSSNCQIGDLAELNPDLSEDFKANLLFLT
jgi:hypothetical protein